MPTLQQLRRATADKVAPYELAVCGVENDAGVYAGVVLDANRRRICSTDLVSVDALGSTSENPTDYLKNEWLYLLSDPPQQRRVPEGGFVGYARVDEVATGYSVPPDTAVAYVDAERPFGAVVPAGTVVEIHAIPPLRGGKSPGLHSHINHALRVMLREDTVQVPGLPGQTRVDVTLLLPWLTTVGQFVGATYAETTAGVDTYAIPGARLRFDADRVIMAPNTTTAIEQTTPVRVLRPLSSWIKPAGSADWGESTVGLVDEGDQCLGDTDAIALVAAFHVAEAEAQACVVGSAEQTFWMNKAQAFAARSGFLRDQRSRRPHMDGVPFPDFVSVDGPYRGRWGPGFQ